jgi:hypothetical protein
VSEPPTTQSRRFAAIVESLRGHPGVTLGSGGKRGFGSSALQVDGKIFAMLSSREEFVVKLPRRRVDSLVASGEGERFDLGGRVMKEWLSVGSTSEDVWLSMAREAMEFVASKP